MARNYATVAAAGTLAPSHVPPERVLLMTLNNRPASSPRALVLFLETRFRGATDRFIPFRPGLARLFTTAFERIERPSTEQGEPCACPVHVFTGELGAARGIILLFLFRPCRELFLFENEPGRKSNSVAGEFPGPARRGYSHVFYGRRRGRAGVRKFVPLTQ